MADHTDFMIEDGTIRKYLGRGGEVVIPDGVTAIGDGAFRECRKLRSITFPDSVVLIGNNAFEDCRGLTELLLPDSVKEMGECAFENCRSLMKAHLPSDLAVIPRNAFSGCVHLSEIVFPENLRHVRRRAFSGCSGLKEIVIPDGVEIIEQESFYGCTCLVKVTLPESLSLLGFFPGEDGSSFSNYGRDVFSGCFSLEEVHYKGSKTQWEKLRHQRLQVNYANAPEKYADVKTESADRKQDGFVYNVRPDDTAEIIDCCDYSQGELVIPDNIAGYPVTGIGNWAFSSEYSSLRNGNILIISIPETVRAIGMGAFYGCRGLKKLLVPSHVTEIKEKLSPAARLCQR